MDQPNVTPGQSNEHRLPADLAATLDPRFQDALDSPIRRDILRFLNESEHPRRAVEITAELPGIALNAVKYHTDVLKNCGSVVIVGSLETMGGRVLYSSAVAEDAQVVSALQKTRRADQRRIRWRRFSRRRNPLSPRPLITISMGRESRS